ncbi:hypothetical protein [Shouchella clausii]|uniref:hypothetical protein n=1 Tax=Shouchella clausii TaxID=79880 RepID=UPI0026FCEE1B|nr:hypothetical protein [Shouchella clausii]MDO7269409.1 hypothetical protein [Shouchella clausii]MDO7289291.1 hypothetical protein [Shouchella clausii]
MNQNLTQIFNRDMDQLHAFMTESEEYKELRKEKPVILFLSIGYLDKRATVLTVKENSFQRAWKRLYNRGISLMKQEYSCLKIDWVTSIEQHSLLSFINIMTKTKKNYFRQGISFDENFSHAFLEQEINGNAMIQIDKDTKRGYLNEKNIQSYIRNHRPHLKQLDFNKVSSVITFTTKGYFLENQQLYALKEGPRDNGRRDTALDAAEVKAMIASGLNYLAKMNKAAGQFTYGYFSCFDKEIQFYNLLRHASTLYAMIEALEITQDKEAIPAIERGLEYLLKGLHVDKKQGTAYVVDGVEQDQLEVKLGANAAAILAFTKYTDVFQNDRYLQVAQQLANGICQLQQENGGFHHVLHYPSFELKDAFRIVYYDGEAAFALLRLYQLDKNEKWMKTVEKAFDYFIANEYWKNHDHWLSYCTEELTRYKPLRKYFQFGLQNVQAKLDFIYHRITTYPTFLELTLAAYNMIQRMKETEHRTLLAEFDEKKLQDTIHKRAEYQRNGYFYPELAMYYKKPSRILGSFFIRHHSFRSRIDDVEHYLSGYCRYFVHMRAESRLFK